MPSFLSYIQQSVLIYSFSHFVSCWHLVLSTKCVLQPLLSPLIASKNGGRIKSLFATLSFSKDIQKLYVENCVLDTMKIGILTFPN